MPNIMGLESNGKVKRKKGKIFKEFWASLQSFDGFIAVSIVTFLLILIATPVIVNNRQKFTTEAEVVADIKSITSGNWSDPGVWNSGTVPGEGKSVGISSGHTITYDVQSDTVVRGVMIEGTLKFSRGVNTRLKTSDNIMVMSGGTLDMGTQGDFIPKHIKAEVVFVLPGGKRMHGAIPPNDMGFIAEDTGLWAMEGSRWDVHGAPVKRTWSKLGADVAQGGTSVTVENDVADWDVGNSILLTQTSNPLQTDSESFINENEIVMIAGVQKAGNGTQLTFSSPLKFAHKGSGQERGEVGLLTHNIVFTTDIQGVDEKSLESTGQGARDGRLFAHTMFMHGAKGGVQYAEFKYMGNNRALSRYPVHLHQMGESSAGMVIRGNAVLYSGNRAYALHESSNVLIEDNVSYNTVTSPYFVELTRNPESSTVCDINLKWVVYVPHDNTFSHNLGVVSLPVSAFNQLAGAPSDAAIYWLDQKAYQHFVGNVAVGAHASGGPETARSAGFQLDEICDKQIAGKEPILTFVENEAHSNRSSGLLTWCGNCPIRDFVNFALWRNGERGFWWSSYVNPVKLFNSRFFENGKEAILQWSVHTHHQDNEYIGGGKPAWVDRQIGMNVNSYVAAASPDWPGMAIRVKFQNNGVDVLQDHREVTDTCGGPSDPKYSNPMNKEGCQPDMFEFIGTTFSGGENKVEFGISQNINPYWKFVDISGLGSLDAIRNFYLLRPDHETKRGVIPSYLYVAGKTSYVSGPDALLTRASDLPESIHMSGFPDMNGQAYDYTLSNGPKDYPPQVSLSASVDNNLVTLKATATDDKGVSRVEFWQDGVLVSTDTSAPYEGVVDLSNNVKKYTYFYVKAYDGYTAVHVVAPETPYVQNAYSNIVELGPEVLPNAVVPSPTVIATPTAISTVTPIPTPTPIPTATPVPAVSNVARGKTGITASAAPLSSKAPISALTDGVVTTTPYIELPTGIRWIRLDLESVLPLTRINVRHYFGSARSYHDVIVQLSQDGSNWTNVFNNDTNNSAGQGIGTDAEYVETAQGKDVVLASPVNARYIRTWMNGSTANAGNHIVELEAYGGSGTVSTPTPTMTPTSIPQSSSQVSTAGLIGYWKFDETSGATALDSSGNDLNGGIFGLLSVVGHSGRAYDWNDQGDRIRVLHPTVFDNLRTYTISFWMRPDSGGPLNVGRIIKLLNGTSSETRSMELRFGGTNIINLSDGRWSTVGSWRYTHATSFVGNWTHVTVSYDGASAANNARFYINGSLVDSVGVAAPSGTWVGDADRLLIGNRFDESSSDRQMDGRLDELRIYNRVLSASEINALFQAQ